MVLEHTQSAYMSHMYMYVIFSTSLITLVFVSITSSSLYSCYPLTDSICVQVVTTA